MSHTLIPNAARNPGTGARAVGFYASARAAFRALLCELPRTSRPLLLPAFVGQSTREGSGVLDPVRSLDLSPCFYDLNPDATVDVGEFVGQLHRVRPIAALIVHYYGRTDPGLLSVARACAEAEVPLIEDAAHGLLSAARAESALGRHGDATIYSLHKLLPISGGGMLTIRNMRMSAHSTDAYDSLASKLLSYDLIELGAMRRRHFEYYREILAESPLMGEAFDLPWQDLGPDVPQTFPILLHGIDRDRLYHTLNRSGVGVVSLYHTLVPEVANGYPESHRLSRSIINLPLHQDLSCDDVRAVAAAFCSAVINLRDTC